MGQNADGSFTELKRLVAHDVDVNNKLKISSIFAHIQETANMQCEAFGCGWNDLMSKYNVCFILSRMRFEMERYPGVGENISIATWPNKNLKAVFTRYFVLESEDGQRLGSGVSQWVLFDVVKRCVVRPAEYDIHFPEVISRPEPLVMPKGALFSDGVWSSEDVIRACRMPSYSDFDYNGHVNNARYVEWMADILPDGYFSSGKQISVIDVKYKREISYADFISKPYAEREVTLECVPAEDGGYCVRVLLADGEESVQCFVK